MNSPKLILGHCLPALKSFEPNSIDAVVTDPPYGLKFMNKQWDYDVPSIDIWSEVLRVLKPGGHLLSFGGTRTYHRMVVNIEDAGFEIRDQIQWIYGQGFPKSTNVLKAGLKQGLFCGCKAKPESRVRSVQVSDLPEAVYVANKQGKILQPSLSEQSSPRPVLRAEPQESTSNGKEPIMEGRGNLQAEQGELHRSKICKMSEGISSDGSQGQLHNGASASDGETLEPNADANGSCASQRSQHAEQLHNEPGIICDKSTSQTCGRCGKAICNEGLGSSLKPANEPIVVARKPLEKGFTVAQNVLKYGTGAINIDASRIAFSSDADKKLGQSARPSKTSNANEYSLNHGGLEGLDRSDRSHIQGRWPANIIFDEEAASMLDEQSGLSASRFFYCAKASKSERNAGLEGMEEVTVGSFNMRTDAHAHANGQETKKAANNHPTVKPVKLMEYLIKLVTPINGTVLDPFMGSGSTGVAAKNLGYNFCGIERDKDYFEIAKKRIYAKENNQENQATLDFSEVGI